MKILINYRNNKMLWFLPMRLFWKRESLIKITCCVLIIWMIGVKVIFVKMVEWLIFSNFKPMNWIFIEFRNEKSALYPSIMFWKEDALKKQEEFSKLNKNLEFISKFWKVVF